MILHSLNQAQQEAVSAPLSHQLVLAGAGSGKTRVLIHRIAWLIDFEKLSPFNILAVTFTNKAANEMRQRIEALLNISAKSMWMGTFHGLSHRFLRTHWQEAGLPQSFQILDADDQFRLIRRLLKELNLDEDRNPPKEIQWFINAQKEEGLLPKDVDAREFPMQLKIYQSYQEACERAGVIDFADLLLKTCKLLQKNEALLAHYQERFRALLVDEFQDTNMIQYTWLKLFAGVKNSLMIVGDDDQSIYGWRGARIENIQRFSKDFPDASIIRLEQNYRSTGTILKAANALIAKNSGRLGKNLWTEGRDGSPITLYEGLDERDEAAFIANRIRELRQEEKALREIAVFYRSNAQSRVIEEALMQFNLPYRVYGGLRYFDRAEIKDALAYLRLMVNQADDPAFERIINTPTRGIGERTLDAIREHAKSSGIPLMSALFQLLEKNYFSTRSAAALLGFVTLIAEMIEKTGLDCRLGHSMLKGNGVLESKLHTIPGPASPGVFSAGVLQTWNGPNDSRGQTTHSLKLDAIVETVLAASGLIEHYRKEKGEKGLTRVENLEELVNAAYQFTQEELPPDLSPLTAFLAYAALESFNDRVMEDDCVQLMTLHSAKGLEFPTVFLSGCEEELFPHFLSRNDPKALEEERRLCYVGITRAMRKLYMTYAETRRIYGKVGYHRPSRFLAEIPIELIDKIQFRSRMEREKPALHAYQTQKHANQSLFRIGEEVYHPIFGEGIVLSMEGDSRDLKVKVRFAKVGTKVLIASYLSKK